MAKVILKFDLDEELNDFKLAVNAKEPNASFEEPVVLAFKALAPTAVLVAILPAPRPTPTP